MKHKLILIFFCFLFLGARSNDYNRKDWGRWTDIDNDCQNTRHEILIQESLVPVTLSKDGCRVKAGKWFDVYTGIIITNPNQLEIDHLVPLKAAHDLGGFSWDKNKKLKYFNDLDNREHLVAVSRTVNRRKGAKTPEEWLPPDKTHHCMYMLNWLLIKDRWGLRATAGEKRLALEKCNV